MSYAIFKAAGQQYRAEVGRTIQVPLLNVEEGAEVTFDEVLLAHDGKNVSAGQPTVKGASVVADVVRHGKDKKLIIFKYKKRKGYRRKTGHRQQFTEIKITDLKLG